MLPSLEGLEIDEAIKRGVNPTRISIVDGDQNVIDSLRERYPAITSAYAMPVDQAAERIALSKQFKVDIINLDLNSNLSPRTIETIQRVDRALQPRVIGINIQRGREIPPVFRRLTELGEYYGMGDRTNTSFLPVAHDRGRLLVLQDALTEFWAPILRDSGRAMIVGRTQIISQPKLWRAGMYNSSTGVPMLWSVWRLSRIRDGIVRPGIFFTEVNSNLLSTRDIVSVDEMHEYGSRIFCPNGMYVEHKAPRHRPGTQVKLTKAKWIARFNPDLDARDWLWSLENYMGAAAVNARADERAARIRSSHTFDALPRRQCPVCKQYLKIWAKAGKTMYLTFHRVNRLPCPGSHTLIT